MGKTNLKHAAQDQIMTAAQVAFNYALDAGKDAEFMAELERQFQRLEKFYGYDIGSWARGA